MLYARWFSANYLTSMTLFYRDSRGLWRKSLRILAMDRPAATLPFLLWFPNPVRRRSWTCEKKHSRTSDFCDKKGPRNMKIESHNRIFRILYTPFKKKWLAASKLRLLKLLTVRLRGKKLLSWRLVEHIIWNVDSNTRIFVLFSLEDLQTFSTWIKLLFTEKQLVASLMDLFVAGTETTTTTIIWAFVFLLENPTVMRKIQEEIDHNVGRARVLVNADRSKWCFRSIVPSGIQ